jgi:hypothetical protein
MTATARTLVGDPFAAADRIVELRQAVADAAVEWSLAERELIPSRARYNTTEATQPKPPDTLLSRAAATYLDATKRENDAMQRWKAAARVLLEALEGRS